MLVLFDIDDTLLDDVAATAAAVTALHAQVGRAEPAHTFEERWLASLRHHYARYVAGEISFVEQRRIRVREAVQGHVSDAEADALIGGYLQVYEQNWQLFPDTVACLDALASHQLAVVSNGNVDQQRQKLQHFGLLERFAAVVTSDQVGFGKPDRRIFFSACEQCGVSPSDAVHVGDRFDLDVAGALSAGVRAVWLDRLGSEATEHAGVTTIRSLAELPRALATTPDR
jgi:putative hydrolase of the HAD superfamily